MFYDFLTIRIKRKKEHVFKFYDEYFPGIPIYTNGYVNKTDLEIKLFSGEMTKLGSSSFEVTAEQIQIELKSILNETRLNLVNENGQISFHSARVILQRKGSPDRPVIQLS